MKSFFETTIGFSVVLVATITLIIMLSPAVPGYGGDAEWYISIAKGHLNEVVQPFSGRFLQPTIVGWLSTNLGIDLNRTFLFVAIVALALFLIINAALLKKILRSSLLMIPVFFLPYFAMISQAFFLPDAFYIFLSSLFFLFLSYGFEGFSLLILFLLFLTRESTIILGLVFLVISLFRKQRLLSLAILLVIVVSVFTTQQISKLGLPNAHNLSNLSYMALKMPYNLLNNLFGIKLWVNTLPNNCSPAHTLSLPQYLSFGSINKIGFCSFDIVWPVKTAISLLTVFGIMPAVFFYILLQKCKSMISRSPKWLMVAGFYGVVYYLMSVPATSAIQRFAGYGWPAFLLVAPFLVNEFFEIDKKFLIKLALVQILVAWLPVVFPNVWAGKVNGSMLFVMIAAASAYFYVIRLLRNQKKSDPRVI